MLNKSRMKSLYSKLQTELFYMIPERWDRIYLYASIMEQVNHLQTGEMFFYYYPKGILKKEPINVYEIPNKFNIDEENYNKLVDKLYDTIKLLYKEFEDAGEELWSNITISIENYKFTVEYKYEDLLSSLYDSYDRHMIWKYKYLKFPIERMTKRDREMLEQYLVEEKFRNIEVKKYSEGMYKNKVHNIIEYNKEERIEEDDEEIDFERERERIELETGRKLDKYELYKRRKEEEKQKENPNILEKQEVKKKNQILNF